MRDKVKYGSVAKTTLMDDGISNITSTTKYRSGLPSRPTKVRYQIYKKIGPTQKDEHDAYLEFSDELAKDDKMFEPATEILTKTDGNGNKNRYFIKSYTRLEF